MILAMAARRLSDDWHAQYSYRPVLLEAFVEKPRFEGTCYQAANWRHLGQTKGRGKKIEHSNQELMGIPSGYSIQGIPNKLKLGGKT